MPWYNTAVYVERSHLHAPYPDEDERIPALRDFLDCLSQHPHSFFISESIMWHWIERRNWRFCAPLLCMIFCRFSYCKYHLVLLDLFSFGNPKVLIPIPVYHFKALILHMNMNIYDIYLDLNYQNKLYYQWAWIVFLQDRYTFIWDLLCERRRWIIQWLTDVHSTVIWMS